MTNDGLHGDHEDVGHGLAAEVALLEGTGFELPVPRESWFEEVRTGLFPGERWIRTSGSAREGLRFTP
jgi:hypothetical protein